MCIYIYINIYIYIYIYLCVCMYIYIYCGIFAKYCMHKPFIVHECFVSTLVYFCI